MDVGRIVKELVNEIDKLKKFDPEIVQKVALVADDIMEFIENPGALKHNLYIVITEIIDVYDVFLYYSHNCQEIIPLISFRTHNITLEELHEEIVKHKDEIILSLIDNVLLRFIRDFFEELAEVI